MIQSNDNNALEPTETSHPPIPVLVSHNAPQTRVFSFLIEKELKQAFGITPAEINLLAALASGQTPSSFAIKAGKSLTTVRSQLAALYGKLSLDELNQLHLFALHLLEFEEADAANCELNDPHDLVEAAARKLDAAIQRDDRLSSVETQIVTLALRGETARSIAVRRGRSVHTIRTQIKNALNRYSVSGVFLLRQHLSNSQPCASFAAA